jgi:hypothetical protein
MKASTSSPMEAVPAAMPTVSGANDTPAEAGAVSAIKH